MDKDLKIHIEYLLCITIERVQSISGGDISKAFLLVTERELFFCKINHNSSAFQMFQAEKAGLQAIAQTKTIATPKILLCEKWKAGGFLVMEYIESKLATTKDMELFGRQLAALHKLSSSETFGWTSDNFIGSLPQSNITYSNWTGFYVQERLLPQIRMARDSHKLFATKIPTETKLLKTCESHFPKAKPSLLHGDLWSGNFLIAQGGTPYIIDPAVYYGHHEVDIAMTRLFGGFDSAFYFSYAEHFIKIGGEKERSDIYQLYFLLVHLNLFGVSYKASVTNILKSYF